MHDTNTIMHIKAIKAWIKIYTSANLRISKSDRMNNRLGRTIWSDKMTPIIELADQFKKEHLFDYQSRLRISSVIDMENEPRAWQLNHSADQITNTFLMLKHTVFHEIGHIILDIRNNNHEEKIDIWVHDHWDCE